VTLPGVELLLPDAKAWRAWLEEHHASVPAVWLVLTRKGGTVTALDYAGALDEALCFGWIDGVRRRIDEDRYTIRFTPRRPHSIWSATNVRRFEELEAEGRVTEAGRKAFAARREDRTAVYAYEKAPQELPPEALERLKADEKAYEYFSSEAPWYRRNATYWVVSAKRPETRERRLEQLIADSRAGLRIPHLRRS
jgi:uncharacterized protein YdeI (YjbR/CyaY-like superfamily)